jgi:hypothetical protein
MAATSDSSSLSSLMDFHDLSVPSDTQSWTLFHIYAALVNCIAGQPADAFTTTCIVCSGQHKFDDCGVLKNTSFLCDHYICFCQHLCHEAASCLCTFPGSEGHVPLPAITNSPPPANDQVPSDHQDPAAVHFLDTVTEEGAAAGNSNHEGGQPQGLDF